ncbi:MAG TPA: histidine phosphatase family protein [Candidatus Limnocylindrales bacterium]|nr:histidine phosphatase family protein [Candidatus Limnocylindrales bacterium]
MVEREVSMVELYLLRHADAGDALAWAGPDAERPLSRRGWRQVGRLAGLLLAARFRPDLIVSSPLLRAAQTAQSLADALGMEIVVDDRLAGGIAAAEMEGLLRDLGDPQRPVLVGHEPDMSRLVAELCDGDVPVPKGTLVRIDAPRPLVAGGGTLRWLIPPDSLKVRRKP